MSDSLKSSIGNFIIDIDNDVTVDYDKLPKKVTFLFVSSSYAATMNNLKIFSYWKKIKIKSIIVIDLKMVKISSLN
jgi:hypothetical protein